MSEAQQWVQRQAGAAQVPGKKAVMLSDPTSSLEFHLYLLIDQECSWGSCTISGLKQICSCCGYTRY